MRTDEKNDESNQFVLLGELIEQKQQYRKIIKAAVSKWVKDFQDGNVQINSVNDLRTLMQIEIELQQSLRMDQTLRDRKAAKRDGGEVMD